MKCSNCGSDNADSDRFCKACGFQLAGEPGGQFTPQPPPDVPPPSSFQPVSTSYTASSEVTGDDRVWALLAYLLSPWVSIIILIMEDKKSRPFIKAHYMQAMVLGILEILLNIVLTPIGGLGCVTSILTLGINIYFAYRANKGEFFQVPVIGDFIKNQGWG